MMLGKVTGSVVSTIKHESYINRKILVVRPVAPDGTPRRGTLVAVDTIGAGEGDLVLVASEGRAAMEMLGFTQRIPVRSVVIGIVDRIQRGEEGQP